jgi:hypothetical protein
MNRPWFMASSVVLVFLTGLGLLWLFGGVFA